MAARFGSQARRAKARSLLLPYRSPPRSRFNNTEAQTLGSSSGKRKIFFKLYFGQTPRHSGQPRITVRGCATRNPGISKRLLDTGFHRYDGQGGIEVVREFL